MCFLESVITCIVAELLFLVLRHRIGNKERRLELHNQTLILEKIVAILSYGYPLPTKC